MEGVGTHVFLWHGCDEQSAHGAGLCVPVYTKHGFSTHRMNRRGEGLPGTPEVFHWQRDDQTFGSNGPMLRCVLSF